MQKQLEAKVSETAASVTNSKNSIAKIQTQLNSANLALTRARKERESHALQASLGDATAVAAIKAARDAQRDAEALLDDLRVALPAAEASLAEAEKAAASAKAALSRFVAEGLMRKRIENAAQIDAWLAAGASLFDVRAKLGTEIVNMDVMPRTMHGTSNYEEAMGARRLRASLPAWISKLFPGAVHDEMPRQPLAISEAQFWSLPPEQPDEKAKAA
jgi:hypothetical protein